MSLNITFASNSVATRPVPLSQTGFDTYFKIQVQTGLNSQVDSDIDKVKRLKEIEIYLQKIMAITRILIPSKELKSLKLEKISLFGKHQQIAICSASDDSKDIYLSKYMSFKKIIFSVQSAVNIEKEYQWDHFLKIFCTHLQKYISNEIIDYHPSHTVHSMYNDDKKNINKKNTSPLPLPAQINLISLKGMEKESKTGFFKMEIATLIIHDLEKSFKSELTQSFKMWEDFIKATVKRFSETKKTNLKIVFAPKSKNDFDLYHYYSSQEVNFSFKANASGAELTRELREELTSFLFSEVKKSKFSKFVLPKR